MPASSRFIDRLRKAARLEPVKKEIVLASGDEVVMYVTPLTAAERDRARKNARSDDANAFALQLFALTNTQSHGLEQAVSNHRN